MEKWLCWGSLAVAGLFLVLFVLDVVFTLADQPTIAPFGGMDVTLDVLGAVSSALLVYLAWNALREIR
jgi:hypothetical protein